MAKKVLIALPPAMLEQIDQLAKDEFRTRSDLIRESLRNYLERRNRLHPSPLALLNSESVIGNSPIGESIL